MADPGASVHVNGRLAFIPLSQIRQEADVPETAYTLRSAGSTQTNDHAGLSLRKLLVLAGANPDTVGFVSVKRPDGTTAFLQGRDLAEPSPFPEGPALVWVDGETSRFFRPVRNESDVNAADNIGTEPGQPLIVEVHGGPLLSVTATATPTDTTAGATVAFSAHATGEAQSSPLRYTWTFDDGTHGHGASVSHAYKLSGGYNAFVTVRGADDSGGASPTIHVVVGNPPKGPAARAGGGTTKRGAPGGGSASSASRSAGNRPSPTTQSPGSAPATTTHAGTPPSPRGKRAPASAPQATLPRITGELLAYSQPLAATRVRTGAGKPPAARAGDTRPTAEGLLTATAALALVALGAAGEARGRRRRTAT